MTLQSHLTRLIWLSITPVLVAATLLGFIETRSWQRERSREADVLAQDAAALVDDALSTRVGALTAIGAEPAFGPDGDAARAQPRRVERRLHLSQAIGSPLMRVDVDGRLQWHTGLPPDAPLPALSAPTAAFVRAAAASAGPTAVSDLLEDPVSHRAVVMVARRVSSGEAGTDGLLLATLSPDQLTERLRRANSHDTWTLRLRDSHGRLLTEPPPPPDGATVPHRTAPSLAPWRISVEVPVREEIGALIGAASLVLAGLLGSTVFAFVGASRVMRRMVRAADDLAREAPGELPPMPIAQFETIRHRLHDEQAALELTTSQLHDVFAHASDAILTVDMQQRIVGVNQAAVAIFRRPADQLVGQPLEVLMPGRFQEWQAQAIARWSGTEGRSGRLTYPGRVRGVRGDGEEVPLEASIALSAADGQRVLTVVLHDLSARDLAERQLSESRTRLTVALEALNEAVSISDGRGHLVEINEGFVHFHRFRSKADCPRSLADYAAQFELFTTDGRSAPPDQWGAWRALRGEHGNNVEYVLRRRDNGEHWAGSFNFAPIRGTDGHVVGAVVSGRDVTKLKRVQAALERSHRDLQNLIDARDRVQEEERARIARELHDELQQTLTAVMLEVTAARMAAGAPDGTLAASMDAIESLAQGAIQATRSIVRDLRPQLLEELGLVPALEHLATQFTDRTGLRCTVDVTQLEPDDEDALPPLGTCVYRVVQEALTNVFKHAEANSVQIRLTSVAPGRLSVSIRDDGRGMTATERRKIGSFGLLGMHERVRAYGGQLHVESRPGEGTRVEVSLDLVPPADDGAVPDLFLDSR